MEEKNEITLKQEREIIYNYVELGKGQLACAHVVGLGDNRIVKRVLKKYNIPIRNFSEAATAKNLNNRKYTINDNYFAVETHNSAYILGFLAADGSIAKNNNRIKIGLSIIDFDFLDKIRIELGSNKPITTYINSQGYESCTWECSSQTIKKDLARYNIIPQKTLKFVFPKHLSKEYWIDFIRGYWDGDGSISTAGSGLRWQLCSATKDILEVVVDFFYEEYGIKKVKIQENKRQNILYNIQYSTNPTKQIYDFLYNGYMYLPRKKQKYEELLNKNK